MGENKQKHVTSQYSTSKYAIKHQQQNAGHYSPNSPFQSSKEAKEERIKKLEEAENKRIVQNDGATKEDLPLFNEKG